MCLPIHSITVVVLHWVVNPCSTRPPSTLKIYRISRYGSPIPRLNNLNGPVPASDGLVQVVSWNPAHRYAVSAECISTVVEFAQEMSLLGRGRVKNEYSQSAVSDG